MKLELSSRSENWRIHNCVEIKHSQWVREEIITRETRKYLEANRKANNTPTLRVRSTAINTDIKEGLRSPNFVS